MVCVVCVGIFLMRIVYVVCIQSCVCVRVWCACWSVVCACKLHRCVHGLHAYVCVCVCVCVCIVCMHTCVSV